MKQVNSSLKAMFALITFVLLSSCVLFKRADQPVLYLIGDSTVKNGKGKGDGSLWGWGSFLPEYFDLNKLKIENHALGGTSTRTFESKGLLDSVLRRLKPGDYVMMQFGHNDGSPLDDTARARGTIKGTGPESKVIFNPITKQQEEVYTYGAYLRRFITKIKAKGAIPIVCSPIPRNPVKQGKLQFGTDAYAGWAKEIAAAEQVLFVDLQTMIKGKYEQLSADKVAGFFTEKDHTHTNEAGARLNAATVAESLKIQKAPLSKYLKP